MVKKSSSAFIVRKMVQEKKKKKERLKKRDSFRGYHSLEKRNTLKKVREEKQHRFLVQGRSITYRGSSTDMRKDGVAKVVRQRDPLSEKSPKRD